MKMKVTLCKGPPNRGRARWCFENVSLTGLTTEYPNVLLYTGGYLMQPVHEMTMSTQTTTEIQEYEPKVSDLILTKRGKYFFFIYNTENYFHFLYDSLPMLLEFLKLRDDPEFAGIKLLMSPGSLKYPFVYDCLHLLGITTDDIEYTSYGFQYECVVVVNSYTHDGQSNDPPHPDVWELYNRMKTAAFQTPIETPKKFYVSRRSWIHGDTTNIGTNYTTRRKIVVEDQWVEQLKSKGYEEVFCEKLSMAEKIQYFANATHIVGAIGGGMCNLVFSPPECCVLSINSPEFDTINSRFLYTMKHTNLTQFKETQIASPLYRRVRIGNKIGEVYAIENGKIWIILGNGITWNDGTMWVEESEVTYLDKGLNSPWYFDINTCIRYIQ